MDYVRKVGKYLVFASIIIAVLHGLIYQKIFAPFHVSIACWIGVMLWLIGFGGAKLQKYLASRAERRLPTKGSAKGGIHPR